MWYQLGSARLVLSFIKMGIKIVLAGLYDVI